MIGIKGAVDELIAIFERHAHKEGDKETLTNTEMKELLTEEFFQGGGDESVLNNFFASTDFDQSKEVDFHEFMILIGIFADTTRFCRVK